MNSSTEDASELTWFCDELPDLIEEARQQGWSMELERARQELRTGTRPAALVLEVVRDRLGIPTRPRGYTSVPGQDPAPPPPGFYTCPSRSCSRLERRGPGSPLPECALLDEPLTFG